MFDIITVGSATVDVFVHTSFSEMKKLLEPGQKSNILAYPIGAKMLINNLNFTIGGGGTNTAVSFSRLGYKVGWLGKLGNDVNAGLIVEGLRKEKVKNLGVKGKGLSGYSIILDSVRHDRTILAYKGINNDLEYREISLSKLKTKWFYFGSMMGKSFKTLERLAKFAHTKKIKVAFNASQYLAKKGAIYLKNVLRYCDVFILNKDEARILTKGNDIYKMLIGLRKMGPKICIITDGKRGSFTYDGENIYIANSNKIEVVETTGAGDAFGSGFVAGMIKKNDIEFGLQIGTANAESVIRHHGAKNKLINFKEALLNIKRYPCKIKKQRI